MITIRCIFCDFEGTIPELRTHSATCPGHTAVIQAKRLRSALEGIVSIGKRDMSNPKYDGYFDTAQTVLAETKALL